MIYFQLGRRVYLLKPLKHTSVRDHKKRNRYIPGALKIPKSQQDCGQLVYVLIYFSNLNISLIKDKTNLKDNCFIYKKQIEFVPLCNAKTFVACWKNGE